MDPGDTQRMTCSEGNLIADTIEWLLASDEPWTSYRMLVDLLGRPEDDAEVQAARSEMLDHLQVRGLIDDAATWPGFALKRHNDAKHPIYALSTLADFGLRASDPGMRPVINAVMAHQSHEGPFQTRLRLYKRFGGIDGERWTWMACDAPTLLWHWGPQCERKLFLFGIGTFYRRLKYPFVWYDILHVVDVLSRFPSVHGDPRFRDMVDTITEQADEEGRYTAASMYRAWKGWSFADKKTPSPWITLLVLLIQQRIEEGERLGLYPPCAGFAVYGW